MEKPRTTLNLIFGTIVIVALTAVALSPAACAVHRDRQIVNAIKAGADPIVARCALNGAGYGPEALMCLGAKK